MSLAGRLTRGLNRGPCLNLRLSMMQWKGWQGGDEDEEGGSDEVGMGSEAEMVVAKRDELLMPHGSRERGRALVMQVLGGRHVTKS